MAVSARVGPVHPPFSENKNGIGVRERGRRSKSGVFDQANLDGFESRGTVFASGRTCALRGALDSWADLRSTVSIFFLQYVDVCVFDMTERHS